MENQTKNKGLIISFIIVVIFIGLIVYTLVNSKPNNKMENESQLTELNENKTMEQDQNRVAQKGDVLLVKYTGRLEDGTVFDSNVDPKFGHVELFQFVVGAGTVIEGWDTGFIGMKAGEKKTITVPPEKGYGPQTVGIIPPNSTLIFDVELVGIK